MTVEKLLLLQKIELEIDGIRGNLKAHADGTRTAREEETRILTAVGATRAAFDTVEKEHGEAATLLASEEERLKKSKNKLKMLKTNFEFQALQREIENTRRSNMETEETVLKKMEALETLKKTLGDQEKQFAEAVETLKRAEEDVNVKSVELRGLLAAKIEEQKKVESEVDRSLLSKYRFIRERKYQDALVAVVNASCQGCYMSIPHQLYNEILRTRKVTSCPNCRRLIYFKEV